VTYYVTFGKKRNTERKIDQSIPAGHCHVLVSIRVTTNYNIQEEIKSRLKPENACYHSVQNLLSSSSISKNIKIKIYRTIIVSVVLHGCETWSLTLREGPRLRVFENRVCGESLGLRRTRQQGSGENYIMRSLMICTRHQLLLGDQIKN